MHLAAVSSPSQALSGISNRPEASAPAQPVPAALVGPAPQVDSTSQLAGWGAPHPASLDATKIYGVQWQVNSPGASYDVWVDDVQFTGCP